MTQSQKIARWAPIVGNWEFKDDGLAIYQPDGTQPRQYGISVSGIHFSEGYARTTITLPEKNGTVPKDASGRIMLGYRSPNEDYISVGLGGYASAFVISSFNPVQGWSALALAGNYKSLRHSYPYLIEVRVRGQNVILEVDHIRVLEQRLPRPLGHGQLGLFAWGPDPVSFSSSSATKERGTVFVVMQFSAPRVSLMSSPDKARWM